MTLIIGDVGQAGEQDVSSKQIGGDTQNSANTANDAQSLGSLILIGDARQRNRQRASADQSHKKGIQNSANALSNAQSIATDVIIGDSDQDNNQSSLTSQTAESTASDGSTIVIGGIIEISVDDDLPSVDLGIIEIDPVGGTSTINSSTTIENSQVILGST